MNVKSLLRRLCRPSVAKAFAAAVLAMPLLAVAVMTAGCDSVNDERIPPYNVHLTFPTVGDWNVYGVQEAAAGHRIYINTPRLRVPSDFPYSQLDYTGFGGLLLVTDVLGDLHAYDLACPYECKADVRIDVPAGSTEARCPSCHSTFSIYTNFGNPTSGPAADRGYALQKYHVHYGGATEYCVISR